MADVAHANERGHFLLAEQGKATLQVLWKAYNTTGRRALEPLWTVPPESKRPMVGSAAEGAEAISALPLPPPIVAELAEDAKYVCHFLSTQETDRELAVARLRILDARGWQFAEIGRGKRAFTPLNHPTCADTAGANAACSIRVRLDDPAGKAENGTRQLSGREGTAPRCTARCKRTPKRYCRARCRAPSTVSL